MVKRKWSAAARSATVKSAPATRIVPIAAAARGTRHAVSAAIATTTGIVAITAITVGNTTEEADAAAREGADGILPESKKRRPAKIFAGRLFFGRKVFFRIFQCLKPTKKPQPLSSATDE